MDVRCLSIAVRNLEVPPSDAALPQYGDLVLLFSKVWELFETILFFSQKVTVLRRIGQALSGDLFRTSVNLNRIIVFPCLFV